MFGNLMQMMAVYWPYMLATAVVAYLFGSINFAILVTRVFSKTDIRDEGSGNAGMTNVLRSHGKWPAVLTALGDVGKSLLAGFLGGLFFRWAFSVADANSLTVAQVEMAGRYIAGLFCALGHTFPIFFDFRGGKGVLVGLGVLIMADWRIALPVLAVFMVVVAIWRMVSLASLCATASAIPVTWFVMWKIKGWDGSTVLFSVVATTLVVILLFFMHRGNMQRIIAGTERKLSFGKKENDHG